MQAAHKLWTKTAFQNVPPLYGQDTKGDDAIVYVKIFCTNGWRWYVTEYDPDTGRAFGLVQGDETELGYFMLNGGIHNGVACMGMVEDDAFQAINNTSFFPPFERDLNFKPTTLDKVKESIESGCPA